jgi:2-desacetyl-2-hydroxyethyl bacteriochlorophyllide A dehydrogenase
MRAAVYLGARTFAVQERREPAPTAGHVAIDVAYTGICGTDLHIFHGHMDHRVTAPAVIGHEMAGRVAAVGEGVDGWAAGDPVTVMPLDSCGLCPACRSGHTHLCHRLRFLGIDATGSMQSRWTVPAEVLVRVPADLSLEHAALVEPTAVAVHDVARADLQPGEQVLVVGGGPIGVLIALVARRAGADVLLLEPNPHRRAVAEAVGTEAADPLARDITTVIDGWTGGAGPSAAFEVSGSQAGMDFAVSVLAARGRLVLVGIHPQPIPVDLHRFFWRELTLVGARLYQRDDFDAAVTLVADGVVPADTVISQIEPLANVAGAFVALESGGSTMKVLIDCRDR